VRIDGIINRVGGCATPGTMYPVYRHDVTNREVISSPLTIDLSCNYDSVANTGSVTATITNTSSGTVNGTLHFVLIENNIPYNWGGLTTVEHVCRDMLPDQNGESVSIPASGNIIRSRNFTVNSDWNEQNCNIVVFVQGSSREIYQGAEIDIVEQIDMDYCGLTFTEISGNGNRIAQPGETVRLYIKGKNNGSGTYPGGATISESDPYVSITSSIPQTVTLGPGDVDTVLTCDVSISLSCPSPHTVPFLLDFGTTSDTNTVNFIVTHETGFSDDIESGQGSWTHSGAGGIDNWHISTYRSHSPTHSWYCGVESSHQYTDRNDASLVSPYFVATPDSMLRFWHYYALESNYDYGFVEIDNNCGWWVTLGEYTGSQTSWNQISCPLSDYAGQTVRLRFRFTSDQNTLAEGWYIDDVQVPSVIGIKEEGSEAVLQTLTLQIYPNPFSKLTKISFGNEQSVPSQRDENPRPLDGTESIELNIYDATGRLVKSFNLISGVLPLASIVCWDGTDKHGLSLPAGVYFIRLKGTTDVVEEKIILTR